MPPFLKEPVKPILHDGTTQVFAIKDSPNRLKNHDVDTFMIPYPLDVINQVCVQGFAVFHQSKYWDVLTKVDGMEQHVFEKFLDQYALKILHLPILKTSMDSFIVQLYSSEDYNKMMS